jgi:hypothetical protein
MEAVHNMTREQVARLVPYTYIVNKGQKGTLNILEANSLDLMELKVQNFFVC